MKKIPVWGVTGVIGSGKSVFCKILSEKYSFFWINTDKIVHDLYKYGNQGYKKIKEFFGEQFIGEAGVYRGRLRLLVAKSPQKLWILNKLIHPLVTHEVNKKIDQLAKQKTSKTFIGICLEAVYFEKESLGKFIDRLIVIEASDKQILVRLSNRKIPIEQLKKILKFQRENLQKEGIVVENNSDLESFYKKIERLVAMHGG